MYHISPSPSTFYGLFRAFPGGGSEAHRAGNFALYSRGKGAYLDAMRRSLAPLIVLLYSAAAAATATAEKPPAVCIDRIVVGAYDAAKRPYFHLFEFTRRAAGNGEVSYVYRGWLAKPEETKVLFDTSWKAPGEPCALVHTREVRVLKPSGDHLEVGVLQDGAPRCGSRSRTTGRQGAPSPAS